MTALANKVARLEGPLHSSFLNKNRIAVSNDKKGPPGKGGR
jgi:hypothetical protein